VDFDKPNPYKGNYIFLGGFDESNPYKKKGACPLY
jgi:hypothetical protein